jgi:XTP/dITP diphosphohydrolase
MILRRGDRLVVASHNEGKVREFKHMLEPLGLAVSGARELGLSQPEESAFSFEGNARLKARAAAEASGVMALADDSGLSVAALGGAPGIYSARWAGPNGDFAAAMARVERELKEKGRGDTSARFICVLSLASPDGESEAFRGEVEGHLVFPPRGHNGFGYDPIFIANGMRKTFGEIDPELKHAISHRAKAFEKMRAHTLARK